MLEKCIKDVLDFDKKFGIEKAGENKPTYENLFYTGLCLVGESGEIANVLKKIWRDGDTIILRDQLEEEISDLIIYVCKLILVGKIDFPKAWNKKQEKLLVRWKKKQTHKRQVKI